MDIKIKDGKKYADISSLKNWDLNPRSMTEKGFERLKKQIKKLGQHTPLIITEDGTVMSGNMRLKAMLDMGLKDIWIELIPKDKEKLAIEYALSANDRAGKYEADQLANLIGNFPDVEWGDFTVDLKEPQLVSDLIDQYSEVVEDEVPEVPKIAESKLGEVYQLGRHRLMCGDSTDAGSVAILMNGQKADMVFTDPPYGVNIGDKSGRDILGDGSIEEMGKVVQKAFVNLSNSIKDGAGYYVCSPQGGDMELMMMMMMRDAGIKCRHQIIWKKDAPVFSMGRLDYDYMHEPILYGWKKSHQFYSKNERSVWEIARPKSSKLHPTMKPIELCAKAIKNSSKDGDIVIDLFGGSGSTLIACEQTNRTCYMMELDPHYVDVIKKRYTNFVENNDKTTNGKS